MFYNILCSIARIVMKILFKVRIYGDNKLKDGKLIICANHQSNFDPIALATAVDRQVFFMAKKELFKNKLLGKIFAKLGVFPVDRKGADLQSIRKAIGILDDDDVLGIFPEGTRVEERDPSNMKEGVSFIALKAKADIQPVYIESDYKFRGKLNIYFRDLISIDEYLALPKKQAKIELGQDVFNEIYYNKKKELQEIK